MSSCVNICLLLSHRLCFQKLYFNAAESLIKPLISFFMVCYQTAVTWMTENLHQHLDLDFLPQI